LLRKAFLLRVSGKRLLRLWIKVFQSEPHGSTVARVAR
jgi:hypothetical protein